MATGASASPEAIFVAARRRSLPSSRSSWRTPASRVYSVITLRRITSGASTSSSRSPFLFTGQRADANTGLVYFGARYYDPELGLFISHDPARQFVSPYTYTGGDPLNTVDPDGTFVWLIPIILAVLASVAASVDAYVKTGDIGVAAKAGALTSASTAAGPLSPVLQAVAPKEFGEFDAGDWAISQVPVAGSAYGAARNFDNGNYASGAVGVLAAALVGAGGLVAAVSFVVAALGGPRPAII